MKKDEKQERKRKKKMMKKKTLRPCERWVNIDANTIKLMLALS